MIKFHCNNCSQKLGVPDKYAGRRMRCNKCNEPALVPRPVVSVEPSTAKAAAEAVKTSPVKLEVNSNAPSAAESAQTNIFDGFDLEADNEDARRMEAIQIARQDRVSRKTAKKETSRKSDSTRKEGFSMMAFADMVPPAIAFPLSLVTCVVALGATIGIWVVAARATEARLGFFSLLVPVAGAFGLRLFMVNRTFLLGLLGLIIGVMGIGVAKIAISEYVVKDYYQKASSEEILLNLDKILTDAAANSKGQSESVKHYAMDGTFQLCTALISLVDDGEADPVKTRAWIVHILRASNKTNVFNYLLDPTSSKSIFPELNEQERELFGNAGSRVFDWDEQELLLRNTKKYYPALKILIAQCEYQRILADPDKSFKYCLIQSFGLFDAVWILLGMGLSYVLLTFD